MSTHRTPARLARLKSDLSSPNPLPLAELLTADGDQFISTHRGDGAQSSRLYLYSWGLAYFLAFEQPLLGTKELDRYVSLDTTGQSEIERFEVLIGMPLAEFGALCGRRRCWDYRTDAGSIGPAMRT